MGFDVAHAELGGGEVAAGDGEWAVGYRFDLEGAKAAVSDRRRVVHGWSPLALDHGGRAELVGVWL